jgi:hypothetical protein
MMAARKETLFKNSTVYSIYRRSLDAKENGGGGTLSARVHSKSMSIAVKLLQRLGTRTMCSYVNFYLPRLTVCFLKNIGNVFSVTFLQCPETKNFGVEIFRDGMTCPVFCCELI